jgi:hypothetical protein
MPIVTSVSPSTNVSSGTSVTITGSDFTGATGVKFGSTPANTFTVNSDTQITANYPGGVYLGSLRLSVNPVGTVNVSVTGPNGISLTSSADQVGLT